MGKTILILPDSHSKPGVSNARYDWLARLILDRRPDIIVDLGDFADMESLSSYDKGKLSGQNRHVGRDIEVAQDARRRVTEPLRALQEKQRRNKEKLYLPRLVALGGNHEERVDRYVNDHPELYGVLTQDVSDSAKLGWEWYPYQKRVVIEGINFRHNYQQGGKTIGGKYSAANLLAKGFETSVAGDSHKWAIHPETTFSGKRIYGLIAGCYFGHEEAYAGTSNADWVRCLTLLYGAADGTFQDHEKISYERVQHEYGGAA